MQRKTDPIGEGDYVVQPGDCMASIAEAKGHFWEVLWDDPANAQLKEVREDPNVLLPGDRVTVPPLRQKKVGGAVCHCHRFRRKGVPERLRIQLKTEDDPRGELDYILEVGALTFHGKTDADGVLDHWIPPGATEGRLVVEGEIYVLDIGHLDPVEGDTGTYARLENLGYVKPEDQEEHGLSEEQAMRKALLIFQLEHKLDPTGMPDAPTLEKLIEIHGS